MIDILDLPPPDQADIESVIAALPIAKLPQAGAEVDGYALERMLADARYSRVFLGRDTADGRAVVVKFPKEGAASQETFRQAFMRESWIAARVRSPFVGEIIEPAPGRATQLYSVMPFYGNETLERRLLRAPPVRLAEGVAIATGLGKAVAALHRAEVIHRDITSLATKSCRCGSRATPKSIGKSGCRRAKSGQRDADGGWASVDHGWIRRWRGRWRSTRGSGRQTCWNSCWRWNWGWRRGRRSFGRSGRYFRGICWGSGRWLPRGCSWRCWFQ